MFVGASHRAPRPAAPARRRFSILQPSTISELTPLQYAVTRPPSVTSFECAVAKCRFPSPVECAVTHHPRGEYPGYASAFAPGNPSYPGPAKIFCSRECDHLQNHQLPLLLNTPPGQFCPATQKANARNFNHLNSSGADRCPATAPCVGRHSPLSIRHSSGDSASLCSPYLCALRVKSFSSLATRHSSLATQSRLTSALAHEKTPADHREATT